MPNLGAWASFTLVKGLEMWWSAPSECRIGEEGSGGRVIGFTDCMNIMPGHGHRQRDCPIRKMISYNVKESGKPAV